MNVAILGVEGQDVLGVLSRFVQSVESRQRHREDQPGIGVVWVLSYLLARKLTCGLVVTRPKCEAREADGHP